MNQGTAPSKPSSKNWRSLVLVVGVDSYAQSHGNKSCKEDSKSLANIVDSGSSLARWYTLRRVIHTLCYSILLNCSIDPLSLVDVYLGK
jgi:hypothetical protein